MITVKAGVQGYYEVQRDGRKIGTISNEDMLGRWWLRGVVNQGDKIDVSHVLHKDDDLHKVIEEFLP